jgi:hypothetical protein
VFILFCSSPAVAAIIASTSSIRDKKQPFSVTEVTARRIAAGLTTDSRPQQEPNVLLFFSSLFSLFKGQHFLEFLSCISGNS